MTVASSHKPRGFTLIELMVVIAIISVLATLSMGIISVVGNQNRIAAANADIQRLSLALQQYFQHAGRFPPTSEDHRDNYVMYGALTGDTNHDGVYTPGEDGDIPRNHRYWRGPYVQLDRAKTDEKGNFLDPWGEPYRYLENRTEAPRFEVNPNSFLLYSCGPDRAATEETREEIIDFTLPYNRDNVTNWEN